MSTAGNPELGIEQLTDAELVLALAALPAYSRLLMFLADVEDRSYQEIARTCGIPVRTVAAQLHRSRSLLARLLAAQLSERDDRGQHIGRRRQAAQRAGRWRAASAVARILAP